MEIDLDVYFWMVDRGLFDDDQRNKVDMDRGKVILHREHSFKFENACYVAQLMLILKRSVVQIKKKPFTLDPSLNTLKDNASVYTKAENWTIVLKELKKFGVRVDTEKKDKIVEGKSSYISDILGRLFDFDTGVASSKVLDVNSSVIVSESRARESSLSDNRGRNLKSIDDSQGLKVSQSLILNAPLPKKGTLEPMENQKTLHQRSASRNQEGSSLLLLQKNNTTSPQTKPSDLNLDAFNDMDVSKELKDCKSTFEFILLGLSKHLDIRPKQAIGLLSDNHKYLIHIVVKGTKGGEFQGLINWYNSVSSNSRVLASLIYVERGQNALQSTLNIMKSGLYSSHQDLAKACCKTLSMLGQDLVQLYGDEMATQCWKWLIEEPNNQIEMKLPKTQDQNLLIKGESGLQACIYALKRHSFDFIEHLIGIWFTLGKSNYQQLFTQSLQIYFTKTDYVDLIQDILYLGSKSALGKSILFISSILDAWIDQCIKQADFDTNNTLSERTSALSFLSKIWELIPGKIEARPDIAQAILAMLKRGCRDRSKTLRAAGCEMMFRLFQKFTVERNQYAPVIYKTLTFLLIEFHSDLEQREQLFQYFTTILEEIDSIPVIILSEPLLKQIQISDGSTYHFNVFDFEFFKALSNHKRLNVSSAIMILEIMTKLSQNNVFFANIATSIIKIILFRYKDDPTLKESVSQVVTSCLKMLVEQEKNKSNLELEKKKQLILNARAEEELIKNTVSKYTLKKLQEDNLVKRMQQEKEIDQQQKQRKNKERLLVNFLSKLIKQTSSQEITEDIKAKVLGTYYRIEKELKVRHRALNYLLGLFNESVSDMMRYYIDEVLPLHDQFQDEIYPYVEKHKNSQLAAIEYQSQPDSTMKYEIVPYEPKSPNKQTIVTQKRFKDKAQKELEKIKSIKLEITQKQSLEEELKKMKDDKQLAMAKKKLEERKILHGIDSKIVRGRSEDQANFSYEGFPGEDQEYMKRLIVPVSDNKVNWALNGLDKNDVKKAMELQLFDITFEEQSHQDAVKYYIKKNLKIFRHLFNSYCFTGPQLSTPKTFDEKIGQLSQINISEILKMFQDYNITKLQVSKEDLITFFRLINKDILKKTTKMQPSLLVLEFEGFLELLLQIAVHIFSFEAAMTPYEYLEKLFNHFKRVAKEKGLSTHKLFQDPDLATMGDANMKIALNQRLSVNPNSTLPDGFTKVVEKDVQHVYKIPDYLPIPESQKISIELLDEMIANHFGFHFLEPMIQINDVHKVRQTIKYIPKEGTTENSIPRYLQPVQPKSRQRLARNKLSTSMDVNPIRSSKHNQEKKPLPTAIVEASRPQLGAILKIEVGKKQGVMKSIATEVSYVLEDLLQAVEKGKTQMPRSSSYAKPRIINRALEGKQQQKEEDEKLKQQQKQRFDQRKQALKDQLEKMKEEQNYRKQELDEKKKLDTHNEKQKQKKFLEQKAKDFEKVVKEAELKKEQRKDQEPKVEPIVEKKLKDSPDKTKTKEHLKKKQQDLSEMFTKQAEERQALQKKKEEEDKIKEDKLKKQKEKASYIYTNQKQQIQEKKEVLQQKYLEFKESDELKYLLTKYEKQLQTMFDSYSKFDPNHRNHMTEYAFKQMGTKSGMVPQIISSSEYIYLFKTILRDKVKAYEQFEDRNDNMESHKLNITEFIEVLIKISCFSKAIISALYGEPEQVEVGEVGEDGQTEEKQQVKQQEQQKQYKGGSTLRIHTLNSEQLLEKELDLGEAPIQTLEQLFKFLNFK